MRLRILNAVFTDLAVSLCIALGACNSTTDVASADMSDGKTGAVAVVPGQYQLVARVFGGADVIASRPYLVTVR
jgi:hypothetical protein